MKKIFMISNQTASTISSPSSVYQKANRLVVLLALLIFGMSSAAFAQCTNMVMSNGTPLWNGNEYCTGYNPAPINAPIINYTGTCSATPAYSYKWEQNINSGGWTTILANAPGTTVSTVPGFNPPALINTPAGNPQATYQWRLTIVDSANSNQSAQSSNFTIFISSEMSGSNTNTLTCLNPVNGSINLTVNGGLSGATYTWSGSNGGIVPPSQVNVEDPTGLTAGDYNVIVVDGGCANLSYNVTVSGANALSASISSTTNILCFGASTGAASVTASGGAPSGSPTYTYSWSPSGGTAASASGLAAGTYTVQVTDGGGCIVTTSTTLTQPSSAVSASTTNLNNVSCFGGSNGSASVTAGGGTPGYTYSWAPVGGTASTASGLIAGIYTVTVTDANMCTATSTVTISEPTAVTASTSVVNNVSCFGGSNGSASVTAGGGTSGYTYSWAPTGGTAATATGLAAGNYTVTVSDANGCTATSTVSISQPTALSASTNVVNHVVCNGTATGSASVDATGGTPSYTYSWAPSGGAGATASGLAVGTYTVTVTDGNLCSVTSTVAITEPAAVTGTTSVINNVSCNGGSNGQAMVIPAGGTGYGNTTIEYTITFSGLETVPTAQGSVELYDADLNIVTTAYFDNSISGSLVNTGSLTVPATNPPYTLTLVVDPDNNSHSVTTSADVICDYLGTVIASGTITGPASTALNSLNVSVPNCYGSIPSYTYSWASSGGTSATTTNTLAAGTYTVTITDAQGCTGTATTTITEPTAVSASASSTAPTCPLFNNGTATVVAGGGTPGYTYSWSSGGSSATETGLSAGSYTVTVTDANLCSATSVVTLTNSLVGPVHNITTGLNYCSIQEAIDAVLTVDGNIIEVDAGVYAENVIVNKKVKLFGPNATINACNGTRVPEAIIVPATDDISFGIVVEVKADDVEVSGFTIDGDNTTLANTATIAGSGAGVNAADGISSYDAGVDNMVVKNNIIKNLSFAGITIYPFYGVAGTPSSGHDFSQNNIQDLGTYNAPSAGDNFWGIGVLEYNNGYAYINNNCMSNVRLGVQTGNFYQANPGTSAHTLIENNTIQARSLGVFFNLHYSAASPLTVQNNTITPLAEANESDWNGVLVASHASVNSTIKNNTITATGFAPYSKGIEVWNVYPPANATLIQENTITDVSTGIFVNNYDGYNSNANGSHAVILGNTVQGCDTSIYAKDNSLSSHNAVSISATNNFLIGAQRSVVFTESQANTVSGTVTENFLDGSLYTFDASVANTIVGTCNWHGSSSAATVAGKVIGSVNYTPWLVVSTDINVLPGFQPAPGCSVPCALVLSMASVSASCPAFTNGEASVSVTSGGTGTYTYLWSPGGQTSSSITGLVAGTYTVTVTDQNGCSTESSVTVGTTYIALSNPIDAGSTVECLPSGLPTPPTVTDVCGNTITPTGPVTSGTYAGCGGTQIYTYTYSDAFGSTVDWAYTYTINHITPPVVPANGSSIVECASSATPPTSLPSVNDVCGSALTASTPVLNSIIKINFSTPVSLSPTAAPGVWYTDRYAPAGFATGLFGGDSVLIHSINAADGSNLRPGAFAGAFYNTQGRGFDYGTATTYAEAQVYVPSDWATSNKRMAGLWGVAVDGSNAVTAYPIVEFTSDGGNPRFRAYDNGPFVDLGLPTGFVYNSWVTLKMQLLSNGQFLMSAGDKSYTSTANSSASVRIKSAILQGHNYDATIGSVNGPGGLGVTYDIYWDNLKYNDAYTAPSCEGEMTYTYEFEDCAGLVSPWTYTYTIDHTTPPVVPANGGSTVECLASATAPTPPSGIVDVCGASVTAVLVSTIDAPASLTCEGSRTYNYTYTDCSGLVSNWAYVYTIDRTTAPAISGANVIVGTSPFQDSMWVYDATTYAQTAALAPSLTGFTITGMNSITRNPVDGLYYGIAKVSAGGRRLVTVNISNGVCTDIGALVDNFSSLTFHTDGTLFAATGNGATISPETLYRINTSTAAATLVKVMGNGADGEVIAYNYDDGMLYHWSGNGTAMMEKMDTVSGPYNFIPISGSLGTGEIFGAVYIGGGNFLISTINSDVRIVSTTGTVGPVLFTTPDDLRGLGFDNTSVSNSSTVACASLATAPTLLPTVRDVCGNILTPTSGSPVIGGTSTGCAGTKTYTYNYVDCSGLPFSWTYTYTIDTPVPVSLTCATSTTVAACQSQSAVNAAFASWLTTASFTGGCDAVLTNNNTGAPSAAGGSTTVTFTVTSSCEAPVTCTATYTVPATVTIDSISQINVSCNGGSNGSATVHHQGGTSPYSYSWAPSGGTNATASGLSAGSYTVTVSDVNGCSSVSSVTITEPTVLVATETHTDVLCNGGSTGTASISATGGTAPYTGTGTFTGLAAGTYTYNVSDANGCTSSVTVTIGQPTAVLPVVSITPITCFGLGNGSASVAVPSGGTPYTPSISHPLSYDYFWSTGGTGITENLINPGTHTLTVVDVNGCVGTTTFTMTQPPLLVASTTLVSNATCFGLADGHAFVTIAGGTPLPLNTYNISWSTGGTFINEYVLPAGTHTVTVTDANGCQANATVFVTEPDQLIASSISTAIACNGGTATVTVGATGGTSPYTGTGNFTVTAGTYTYTVTDNNGCTSTTTITVTEPSLLSASSTSTAIACNGGSADVTVSATGGTAPYTGTGTFTVTAGTYTYTVTDNNGCTATTTITVTEPTAVIASSTSTSIACNGGTADVTVSATGGTAPYTGTGTFTVTAGTYTYTVTDNNGCAATTTITVTEPTAVIASSTSTSIACNGGTADVTVSATGGTAPYTGTGTFTVTAGTYTYTVTDNNGCTSTTSITVTEPTAVIASSTSTSIACNGGTADVTVSATGGTAPYTGTGTFTVTAGTYTYTVTDNNGCTATTTITVTEPSALFASSTSTSIACNGGSADVTVSATGGTAPYTGTGTFTVTAGTYTYTVTDNNGCTSTTSITVTEPAVLVASSTSTSIACNGGTADVTVSATGGTAPYTGTGTFTVTAGTYTYTVTDNNGCTATTSITVTEPTAVIASSTSTSIACNGGTADVTVSATGGTAPYTGTGTFTVTAGTYTYTVTDNNGCTSTTTITVTEPTAVIASSTSTSIACNGGTADVTVDATGGTAPYTGTGTFTVTAGTYTYTVTDNNGCTSTTSITVTEPAVLVASSTSTSIACNGGTADVTVSATGGTAPYTGTGTFTVTAGTYTYTVTDNNGCTPTTSITVTEPTAVIASSTSTSIACNGGTADVTVSATGGTAPYTGTGTFTVTAGTYTYTVTDNNGCTATTTITVTEPSALVASSTSTSIICNGGTADVTVSATGGTAPYTGTGTFTVTAGTYTYTVTDNNGCTSTTSITVTQPAVITMSSTEVSCDSYTWNMNTYTTSGVHTGTFTASNGCDSVHTINLTINYSSSSTISHTASLSYTWPVTGMTYTNSGTYTGTIVGGNAVGCDSNMTLNLTILGVTLNSKVFLDGPYNGAGLMHDSLRAQGNIPSTEPYSVAPFFKPTLGDAAGESAFAGYLADNGNASIVDWVFLELRSGSLPNPGVVYTQRALVRRDGQIVSEVDGVSPVTFSTAPAGNYFVSIKHRNHLGVMTNAMQSLTLSGATVDFTTIALWTKPSIPAIVNAPAKVVSGVQILWAGDANRNKNTKYNGFSNDKESVLSTVGTGTPNNVTLPGYRVEDVNMDGVVKYNNTNADRLTILGTVGTGTPNAIYNQHTPD